MASLRPTLAAADQTESARPKQLSRLLRWLETLDHGVLIALDDLHWADSDSLAVLSLLCRRIGSRPVAIIATMRAWPEDARDMAARLVEVGAARLVRLRPLGLDASDALITERSGRAVSDVAAAKAWQLCAGNPLLLEQVALAIGRGAVDVDEADAWPALGAARASQRKNSW